MFCERKQRKKERLRTCNWCILFWNISTSAKLDSCIRFVLRFQILAIKKSNSTFYWYLKLSRACHRKIAIESQNPLNANGEHGLCSPPSCWVWWFWNREYSSISFRNFYGFHFDSILDGSCFYKPLWVWQRRWHATYLYCHYPHVSWGNFINSHGTAA